LSILKTIYTKRADASLNKQSETNITLNKKLCYCSGTVRRTMLVNSCYVSQGMKARKVSNSKSDLQRHSRALAMVPFDRPHTISY